MTTDSNSTPADPPNETPPEDGEVTPASAAADEQATAEDSVDASPSDENAPDANAPAESDEDEGGAEEDPEPAAIPSLLDRDQMTAAEREYQAALRAAASLGIDSTPSAEENVDTKAGALVESLGLDQPLPEPEEPDVHSIFDEPEPEEEAEDDSEARAEEEELLADPGDGRAWYVLNTYSGHESRVEKNLDMRIRSMDVADKIFRVVVPTEDEVEIRGGTRRQVQRKLLPGYVLVEMILDDDTWYVVRNTPGVTGFVGTEHPVPLPKREVVDILKQMKTGTAEPRVRVGFEMGDSVRVMEGPFQEFMGEVDEINLDKGKVRVLISMFGRDTPLLLDFIQVEKV